MSAQEGKKQKVVVDDAYINACVQLAVDRDQCLSEHNRYVGAYMCSKLNSSTAQCLRRLRLHDYKMRAEKTRENQRRKADSLLAIKVPVSKAKASGSGSGSEAQGGS